MLFLASCSNQLLHLPACLSVHFVQTLASMAFLMQTLLSQDPSDL